MASEFKLKRLFVWETLHEKIKEFQTKLKFYKEVPAGPANYYDVSIKNNGEDIIYSFNIETEQAPITSTVNYTVNNNVNKVAEIQANVGQGEYGRISLETKGFDLFTGYSCRIDLEAGFMGLSASGGITINSAYTLPLADGTSGYVLTTNGAGQATWQASGGGGGFPLFYFASTAPGDPALARMITSSSCYIQVSEEPKVEMVTPNGAIYLDYTQLGLKTDLPINIGTNSFNTISIDNQNLGFYDTAPITKPTVISGDVNSLITALQQLGLINVV